MAAIKTFSMARLHVAGHLAFHRDSQYVFSNGMFDNTVWRELMTLYAAELNVYDAIVRRQRASTLTQDIARADKTRDEAMRHLFMLIDAAARSGAPAERTAGEKLRVVISDYRKDLYDHMAEQTEQVFGLIRDLQKEEPYQWIGAINAASAVGRLRTANMDFQELYRERIEQRETQEANGISTTAQRRIVDATYRRITAVLNNVAGTEMIGVDTGFAPDKVADLIVSVNGVVEQYRLNLANQARRRKQSDEEELRDEVHQLADLREREHTVEHRIDALEQSIEHTAADRARAIVRAAHTEIADDEAPLHHEEQECE